MSMSKKPETVVTLTFAVGVALSYITGNHWFVIALAVIVPFYLAYVRRETNLLERSRFYDRDFLLMTAAAVSVILTFRLFWDPRIGLVAMVFVIPFLSIAFERRRQGRGSPRGREGASPAHQRQA